MGFTSIFPIITTGDLRAALGLYRDLVGASMTYEFPGPTGSRATSGSNCGASASRASSPATAVLIGQRAAPPDAA
jgi:hypothetical protein